MQVITKKITLSIIIALAALGQTVFQGQVFQGQVAGSRKRRSAGYVEKAEFGARTSSPNGSAIANNGNGAGYSRQAVGSPPVVVYGSQGVNATGRQFNDVRTGVVIGVHNAGCKRVDRTVNGRSGRFGRGSGTVCWISERPRRK